MNAPSISTLICEHTLSNRISLDSRIILRLILVLAIAWAAITLVRRLVYEAQGPITWDTTIYLAVGRGILNGLTPWKDLFETKPVGIFLITAASLALKGQLLLPILQILAILVVVVTPSLLLVGHRLPEKRWDRLLLRGIFLLFGLILGLYCASRAGEIQVESFGAAASALAVLGMSRPLVMRWPRGMLVCGTLGWLGAGALKEPFLFALFGAAMLMLESRREWLRCCLWPLLLAALIGAVGLAGSGWLGSYVHDYLGYMTSYTTRGGSPWHRALDVSHIWNDLNNFSAGFGWFMCLVPLTHLMLFSRSHRHYETICVYSLRLALAVICASFAVGLGGEYFNHHHVFAVPVMLALMTCLIPQMTFQNRWSLQMGAGILTALLCFSALGLPMPNYSKQLHEQHKAQHNIRQEAAYIDAVLNRSHLDRYAFVGSNGEEVYAYTEHSPMGPMFFQLKEFAEKSPAMRAKYYENLKTARVIVLHQTLTPLAAQTYAILHEGFTRTPWPSVADLPQPAGIHDKIYFAKLPGA